MMRIHRGIFIFGGGTKRLRNVTKMYCQCQISHKRRKKECLGKFKFSLNRLKKPILRKPIFVSASKGIVYFKPRQESGFLQTAGKVYKPSRRRGL
jgi:hypothetical protein